MSIEVKSNHSLAELLAKKLFGIEVVPVKEQTKMVNEAIRAAVGYLEETKCPHCGFQPSDEEKHF